MKTSELAGDALDWAVAKCEGHTEDVCSWLYEATLEEIRDGSYHPSMFWSIGGPIIERERITVKCYDGTNWIAFMGWEYDPGFQGEGPTPLIAVMRCFVGAKLGEEVDIPKELL